MQLSAEPLIYGLIFFGVLALVEGLYLFTFGKSISLNSKVNRRLEMMEKGSNREQVLEQLRKEMQQHMKSQSIPLYSLLADKAQKAAIAFSPRQLIMIMGLVSAMAFVGLSIGTATDTALRIVVSIAIGIGGVYAWDRNVCPQTVYDQYTDSKPNPLFEILCLRKGREIQVSGQLFSC